jgi:hypothetical protein
MINNFLKHGIEGKDIDILIAWNPVDGTNAQPAVEAWDKLVTQYKSINFYYYRDTRPSPIQYISSIRPNVLKQHFKAFPSLKNDAIFYCDCDMIFTKKPDFSKFLSDDTWYVSNTNSYINANYILSKGQDVYDKMCEVVGIHPSIPTQHNNDSGGAQYILKNVDAGYWDKVERDCEKLFYEINYLSNKKKELDPEYHELQIWCADMWAVLWNAWMRGNEVKVVPELDFCWATDPIERWEQVPLYHNAGVTCSCGRQFYKALYMDNPPYQIEQGNFSQMVSSYNYVKEILETAQNTCLVTK